MILLLGATGYIGQAFARELRTRGERFIPLSRTAFDYTRFELLFDYVRKIEPEFLINAAGYEVGSSEDPSELDRLEALQANTLLPQTVARVCVMTQTPWGHVSSGSIYTGAKLRDNGKTRIERDLSRPGVRELFDSQPEVFLGFTESDEPNFTFRSIPCNFHSGTKALAEEAIRKDAQNYIWRLKTPFNERDEPCNLLSQLQRISRLHDAVNSLSHLEDSVRACLELWERRAPFGIYNVTNPGAVSTRQVVEMMERILKPDREFEFWPAGEQFHFEANAPRSNCILDVSKLHKAGVKLRGVTEALENSLEKWEPAVGTHRFAEVEPEHVPVGG